MKRFLIVVAAAAIVTTAFAADVGVSVNIGQPGFYGQLNIGDYPQPELINARPIAIERVPMDRPPIYLRVPPGYAKHWRRHCREYNACGERVFFVQDNWYNRVYVPHYQELHRDRRDDRRDEHKDGQREQNRNDHHDHNRDQDR